MDTVFPGLDDVIAIAQAEEEEEAAKANHIPRSGSVSVATNDIPEAVETGAPVEAVAAPAPSSGIPVVMKTPEVRNRNTITYYSRSCSRGL